jgi:DNA polymerase
MADLAELARGISVCERCPLSRTRTHAVPGDGSPQPEIVLIGEGPGFHEDKQGRPFVGPAGQFLDELLGSVGLKRSDVFITNVVKCRPPNNRDPLPQEIEACDAWLQAQLAELKPKLVVTLGRFSMAKFFPGGSISRNHGTTARRGKVEAFAMYHPAAALHNPALRQTILDDMRKIPGVLERLRAAPSPWGATAAGGAAEEAEPAEPKPQQLSLF